MRPAAVARDVGVVIVAGGSGTRVGGKELKQFRWIAGKPMLLHSVQTFMARHDVVSVVCVLPAALAGDPPPWLFQCDVDRLMISVGGKTRQQSVANGLDDLPDEAGLVLIGTEVKSLRGGEATLQQAYAEVRDGEAWLVGLHVPEYTEGNRANNDPDRPRKLLLHRKEIERLAAGVAEKGLTVVPTKLYFKDGRVKVELALGKGKELRDKRRDIADRDAKRQIDRELKNLRR